MAGNRAANLATGGAYAGAPEVPNFGRVAAFKMKVTDEVLASVPRSEIASSELDEGKVLSHLKIVFANGVTWEFDVPKMAKKTAKELVTELGGQVS